jgi:hypothetical protein
VIYRHCPPHQHAANRGGHPGHGQTILMKRERIKRDTIQNRRLQYQKESRLT